MTVEKLIEAAAQLPKPTAEAAAEYAAKSESLAAELNRVLCDREDVETLVGANNTEMMHVCCSLKFPGWGCGRFLRLFSRN